MLATPLVRHCSPTEASVGASEREACYRDTQKPCCEIMTISRQAEKHLMAARVLTMKARPVPHPNRETAKIPSTDKHGKLITETDADSTE